MHQDVLGKLTVEQDQSGAKAVVAYHGRSIDMSLDRDDQLLEDTISLAAEVFQKLEGLDTLAKACAEKALRAGYNNGWNEYDQLQEDGTYKLIKMPKLTSAEFVRKLHLRGLSLTGKDMVDFWYDDEGMFWGHSVLVTSMDGVACNEMHAEIFG